MTTYFVSGHLDLTEQEFQDHYAPHLARAALHEPGASFVVGDARGADARAQQWLYLAGARVTVYHMLVAPRHTVPGAALVGGFPDDESRDAAMTEASDADIAWVRPGREASGTARNLARRKPPTP